MGFGVATCIVYSRVVAWVSSYINDGFDVATLQVLLLCPLHLVDELPANSIGVRPVSNSETCLAAAHQFRVCLLSIWLAGCETGFGCPYRADANAREAQPPS